jgi:hypothetical protein
MPIDFLGFERQFIDHAASVWHAMADRGRFLVASELLEHARAKGIDAEAIDVRSIKAAEPAPPKARPGDGPPAFAVSIGDIKVGRRLGYRRFVFMEHGAGQAYIGDAHGARHPSYAGGTDREDVELFLVPNEYSADLWRRAYPSARVEVVGSPRLDGLPRREPGPGPVICVSFHWPAFVAPEADSAIGYFTDALRPLAQRFTVIGHAHPKGHWPAEMERIYRQADIPFVADFDDVCRQADVYVCDNSSTLFEFASTGRPVVVLNSPYYRKNVHHGLRFWDAADVGVQVDRSGDLNAGVELALEDRSEQQANREAALDIVYAYRSGAAERAAAAVRSMSLQAVA